jgi:peptide/nickel transport system substrate-binding protein
VRGLLAALLILPLASCGGRTAGEATTVTVGRASDAIMLDPARITDGESSEVCEHVYEHLVRYKRNSTEVEPALATSWEVSDKGRAWTFHLRKGVRFHDGTPFDADAVVFSFDRQRDTQHPYHETDFTYWDGTFRNIQRIEKIDDYTIRILIDRPYAPFLANLAMFPVSIVSPQAVRRWGHEFARHPVGTGPFRFVGWVPGDRITLDANADYWDGGPPKIDHLIYRVIPDERQRLVALQSGAVDVAYALAPKDLGFVRLHPDLRLLKVPSQNVAYLAMNMLHPPFDDVRVRRAVNHAVNKNLIIKLLYQSLAIPASGPLPPSMWGYEANVTTYSYDPEKGRQLLREAHVDLHVKPRFYVMSTPRIYIPQPLRVAAVIQRNLHDIGMDVDMIEQPIDRHLDTTAYGEHDLCLRGWTGDNGDPDNFLYTMLDRDSALAARANNVAFYRSAEVHGLLTWAQESSDRAERERLYKQAQKLIAIDAPWVPLAYAENAIATRTDVRDVEVHPSSMVFYKRAWRGP